MTSSNEQKRIVLIVTAHPDDDTLVGGTLAKLAQAGYLVHEFVCTAGQNGKPNQEESNATMAKNREEEIAIFTRELGMQTPLMYQNPNTLLAMDEAIIFTLVKYMREIRPEIIILLNPNDYHFEHRLSYEIGLRAAEIAFRSSKLELGPKLTEGIMLVTDGLNVLSNPLIHFNTSTTHETAITACRTAYDERLGELVRFSNGLAEMRGARVNVMHAEAFDLVNPPWYKFNKGSAQILADFTALGS